MMAIVSVLGGLATQWLNNKAEKSKVKHEVELENIRHVKDWDTAQADASKSSWKDEWFAIILSIPLIMAFIPSLVPYVEAGFVVLNNMPDYYKAFLGGAIAASFGIRSLSNLKK